MSAEPVTRLPIRPVAKPAAWRPGDPATEASWIFHLHEAELDELRGAVDQVRRRRLTACRLQREDFPDAERKRNLLRQWINLRDGRALPPESAERLSTGPRGGVAVNGRDY
jgi:hypothetical protein